MKIKVKITTMIMLLYAICVWGGRIPGDVNGDGRLSVADFSAIAAYIMGNTPENFNEAAADANGDGTISVADLSYIINKVMRADDNSDVEDPSAFKDTLYVFFDNDTAVINNPLAVDITIHQSKADVEITSTSHSGFVIVASGSSSDGRLRIDADTTYTLRLEGLTLTSSHAPAINSISKQKMTLELAEGTVNKLQDAKKYTFSDTTETANGCFSSLGAVTFRGNGTLEVTGKSKHAIYAKKSITFNDGTYNVISAPSDAIHSGKSITVKGGRFTLDGMQGEGLDMDDNFTMSGGSIAVNITGEAAKGIKCSGIMNISEGEITATASGALKNKKGDLSYCTILKCDSNAVISGGNFHLINNSAGGRCISVDHNLTIDGGTFYLETNGDGAEYTNADGEKDYYTSKCVSVGEDLFIKSGHIDCLSTGLGAKGMVTDGYFYIGKGNKNANTTLSINVETTNTCIIDDVNEDKRFGCPKALKTSTAMYIYGGTLNLRTSGMGGEGIESKGVLKVHDGIINCYTYDDGINVGENITINGGTVYCCSETNDGIDSNGIIVINNGNITSISKNRDNECLDADNHNVTIYGGSIIGLSGGTTYLHETAQPYYSTGTLEDRKECRELPLKEGAEYSIVSENNVCVGKIRSPMSLIYGKIFYTSPLLQTDKEYTIYENGIKITSFIPSTKTIMNN